jgi:uncharacterized protein (DUF1697 family)
MAEVYVALLRGINVGGNNKLPMTDLRAMFVAAGCEGVQTYIQSGNVIFSAAPDLAASIASTVSAAIAEKFGYRTPILLRTAAQLREVLAHNPFLQDGAGEEMLHVMFLADEATPEQIGALDPKRSETGRFAARGQDIYLFLPRGVAETKLNNAFFDTKLRTVSTGRNWRTVTRLLALAEEASLKLAT